MITVDANDEAPSFIFAESNKSSTCCTEYRQLRIELKKYNKVSRYDMIQDKELSPLKDGDNIANIYLLLESENTCKRILQADKFLARAHWTNKPLFSQNDPLISDSIVFGNSTALKMSLSVESSLKSLEL